MAAGKPVTEEQKAEFVRLYNAGASRREIADALGISFGYANNVRASLGLPTFTERDGPQVDPEQFTRLYNAGASPQEIADAMGLAYTSIGNIRKRLGLPTFGHPRTDHNRFRELHARGLTARQVAAELHIDVSNVNRLRRRLGLKPFPRPPQPVRKPKPPVNRKRIDRELVRMLDAEGKSAAEIAAAAGCTKKTITRIRRELGISHADATPKVYSREVREKAKAMLESGASYKEVGRTLKIPDNRISKWFPDMGWTAQQTAEYRWMLKKLEALDTRPDRRIYSDL